MRPIITNRDTYPVFIPNNIHLTELLSIYPLARRVPNARDYLLYILKSIKQANFDNHQREQPFTLMNSVKLQKVVQHYSVLLNWLIERGILECDNRYIVNEKPLGYRYCVAFHTEPKQEFIRKRTLVRNILNNQSNISDVDVRDRLLDQSNSVNEVLLENSLGGNGYGYEPIWWRSKEVARFLKLKPNKMTKSLRELSLINDDIYGNLEESTYNDFYYQMAEIRGRKYPALMISEGFIPVIRRLAEDNPLLFPRK